MSVDHYENFPVASWLCPPALRPPIVAIYRFARTADDIADEGDATPAERVADLAAFRADLLAVAAARAPSPRWPEVFAPLGTAIAEHRLPLPLLGDLLDAFAQDAQQTRYDDRASCSTTAGARPTRSAGCCCTSTASTTRARWRARTRSARRCSSPTSGRTSASTRAAAGSTCRPPTRLRHGVASEELLARRDSAGVRALVGELVAWARALMLSGAPLVHAIRGRAGWELRLVVQGGLRILERIDRLGGATLLTRPTLGWRDAPTIAWRALSMRARPDGRGRADALAAASTAR